MEAYEDHRKRQWEDLEVTRDELNSLTECMKKEEFRKLLLDYADEVNDPENRKLYEAEVAQLERERGVEVTFVNPEPGYVIKTSLDGLIKCFVNISKSDRVAKPTSQPASNGLSWQIPYMLVPPRDDLDKNRGRCRVFDVVFHPDALYLAERNSRFRALVNDTAIDGLESNFKVKLDRKNLQFPKMNYKGVSQPTVIRKPCEKPVEKLDIEPEIYQKLMSNFDDNRERWMKQTTKSERPVPPTKYFRSRDDETEDADSKYTIPHFIIKHQTSYDVDEFRESKDAKMHSAIPKYLIVEINLPLLKSAGDANLDVQERRLSLKSEKPAKYRLEKPLPYRVDPDKGNARFDCKLKKLIVTLPVIRDISIFADTKEDSGVESDHGSPLPESQVMNDELVNQNSFDSQKSENGSIISALSENIQVQSDCADTALRTSEELKTAVPFINPNIKYSFPPYTCNLYDNVLAITIHAKNVDSDSIHYKTLENNSGFHVTLASVGAGFFPLYYSLCLKIEADSIIPDTLTIEPWDNNVVLSVKIKNAETLLHYYVGLTEKLLESKDLSVAASIKSKLQALEEETELETDKNVEVIRSGSEVIVNVHSQTLDSDDEDDRENDQYSQEERKRNFIQSRSVSESSGDELPSSIASSNGSGRYKSILKSHNFSRSVSESSIDDGIAPLSSVTFNDSIHEFNSESEGSSLKKTVRFNDVISRQLYRSNSSIFGQRKKNQRKLRNKKRAHERRLSESENSETEEREKYKIDMKNKLESDVSETVRPILLQSNKHSDAQKTANIEIDRSPRNGNKSKQKRNSKPNSYATKDGEKAETENISKGDELWKSFESKSDLMFDLDI